METFHRKQTPHCQCHLHRWWGGEKMLKENNFKFNWLTLNSLSPVRSLYYISGYKWKLQNYINP